MLQEEQGELRYTQLLRHQVRWPMFSGFLSHTACPFAWATADLPIYSLHFTNVGQRIELHTTTPRTNKHRKLETSRVSCVFSFVRRLSSSPFPISVLSPRDGQTDRRRDDGSRSWGCKYRDGERGTEGGVEANEGGRHNCCCYPWWIHTTNEGGPDFTQRASERGSRGPRGGGNTGMEEGLAIHKDTGWRCSHVAGWFTQIHSPRARTVTPINTINANALSSKMSVAAAEITNTWEEQK